MGCLHSWHSCCGRSILSSQREGLRNIFRQLKQTQCSLFRRRLIFSKPPFHILIKPMQIVRLCRNRRRSCPLPPVSLTEGQAPTTRRVFPETPIYAHRLSSSQ